MEINGVLPVLTKMDNLTEDAKRQAVVVIVGYTAQYAVYVHENVAANFKVGQAKFLEQATRQLAPVLPTLVSQIYKATGDLQKSMVIAGLRIQRESQQLTPVDTGHLKGSAFTRIEK